MTAVFICSSDSRRDVLDRVLPAFAKYWPACPYPVYIGLNSHGTRLPLGSAVLAPASQWHSECTAQLDQIAADRLIVMLDDFLIGAPVDQARVAELVEAAQALDLPYLRLLPLGRSLLRRLVGERPDELRPGLERIHSRHPFYSGLQIAIWRKSYLQSLLSQPASIWEFERQYVPGSLHVCVTDRPPITYRHLVERGRWLPHAPQLLLRAGLPTELGRRPVWSAWRYAKLLVDEVRWTVLGYATC